VCVLYDCVGMPKARRKKARGAVAARNGVTARKQSEESECTSQNEEITLDDLRYYLKDFDVQGTWHILCCM